MKREARLIVPRLEHRLLAYEQYRTLASLGTLTRRDIVRRVSTEYEVTEATVYQWFHGATPIGARAGRIVEKDELAYVMGALLGDGCPYYWRGNYQVWLVGEEQFTRKFALMLSTCIGYSIPHYERKQRNFWYVHVGNAELFILFKQVRDDLGKLQPLLNRGDSVRRRKLFIEGFFDAEGCVKVIRDKRLKFPKICLDFCNTNFELLRLVKGLIESTLGIEARYSTQKRRYPNRMQSFHLRIYKKESIRRFLLEIHTTKMKPDRIPIVQHWLEKIGSERKVTSLPSPASSQRPTN